ncbi:SGNH/GDSL hydrolase family protein [Actinomadura kijaniata]|uniref:SGNH/GDSL hydrolase family protein n=1 Tax=Actinomadura kijaniata TaxID=46161 RepID=UPI0008360064|nr:SGNH/GDSL hydrolase family protein [Actinomadura kijaniata]
MRSFRPLTIATALLAATGLGAAPARAGTAGWHAAWGTAAQPATPTADWYGVNWSQQGFADDTVRQVVRLTGGGSRLRIRLSNVYGDRPLRIAGAVVGRAGTGAAVRAGTLRTLRFHGRASTVIPPGREIVSDPAAVRTAPREKLSVTLRLDEPTGSATFHHFAMATSYRAGGDHLADTRATAFTRSSGSWYYLTGVETSGHPGRRTVVAFGDSLTDGVGSTGGADARYPDRLAERLAAAGRPLSVVNAGIGGNRVLTDSPVYGERALSRFTRDVLDRPGVRSVVVMAGVNDLAAWNETGPVTAARLIEGHRTLVRLARARGLTVVGATIMPMGGSAAHTDGGERIRQEVNHWIRTGGAYDAVADFDHVVADGDRLRAAYDSGDHIHLNDTGYRAIADAVDLDTL